MKQIYLLMLLGIICLTACDDAKIGYLKADNAIYAPNETEVRKVLDPVQDVLRKKNDAPWVATKIQGILGTPPLMYEVTGVKTTDGGDAALFMQEISIRGGGIMELPLYTTVPAGNYLVSVRVYNEDHSADLPDAFTFVVK